jgi:hypothetical protein
MLFSLWECQNAVLGMLFPFRYCQIAEMDAFSNMGMLECGVGIARSPKGMPFQISECQNNVLGMPDRQNEC